jgi:hypothetical protein
LTALSEITDADDFDLLRACVIADIFDDKTSRQTGAFLLSRAGFVSRILPGRLGWFAMVPIAREAASVGTDRGISAILSKVNQARKLHEAAVNLLNRLNLDYIRLEPQHGDHYRYRAWTVSPIHTNGSPPVIRKGRVRIRK